MIYVSPISRYVIRYILKALIHEKTTLQEIKTISYSWNTIYDRVIKILTHHPIRFSTSHPPIHLKENPTNILDQSREVFKSSYDDLFNSENKEEYDIITKVVSDSYSPTPPL